ncbi:MAG: hypothetical protein ACXW0T_10630 [Methylobacter sp.]
MKPAKNLTGSEPTTESNTQTYLSLKTGKASKTGQRSHGQIHYRILTDSTHQQLYISITGNDGGGYYSKEIVPFDKVEQCLEGFNTHKPLSSKLFQPAFIGQSSNNAGFLAAILRAENLLAPVPSSIHQHAIKGDWQDWKKSLLALTETTKPYQPELPKPRIGKAAINKTPPQNDDQATPPEPNSNESESETLNEDSTEDPTSQNEADPMQEKITHQEDLDPAKGSIASPLHKHSGKKQRAEKRHNPIAQEDSHVSAA